MRSAVTQHTGLETLTRAFVSVNTRTRTHNMQHPPFTQSTAVVFYSTCIALKKADLVQHFPFFFLFSFFPPCFAVRAEFASKHLLYLNCCPGWKKTQTNVTIPCIFNDLPLFWTQTCQKHHWRQDAGWMDGSMCAAGGRHEREKLKPTCCANDVYMSACESVLCLLKT